MTGFLEELMIFRMNNAQLSDSEVRTAFGSYGAAIPAITDDRDLTWDDIEIVTGGRLGQFMVACPYCGANKPLSRRLKIERPSLAYARCHCFYCGRGGSLRIDGPIDPIKEAEARRQAAALDRERNAERTARALRIWDEAVPIVGTLLVSYLRRRAIDELPPGVDGVLRYHPECPWGRRSTRRVMVALFRDVRSDRPVAIHRTTLPDFGPAERRALGPIARAAVKLWRPVPGDFLVVGEGIETVLSAASMRWRGTLLQPAWAATVANNVAGLPIVRGVKRLILLGDNDETGTGQRTALQAYHRWKKAGRDVLILMPNRVGVDFNDIAIARGRRYGPR
jgi:putative DNA primase/helicase